MADALLVAVAIVEELESAEPVVLAVTVVEVLEPVHSTAELKQLSTGTPGDCKKS
jgi:hypothetical protein